ncbi:hypothetical protein, partial [Escherichia coli]|uniref:hypothetical protein n=1 Tax=Escherichia coli TaxID=562 RepID=UPI00309E64BF
NISSACSHSSGGWARDYIFIYGGKFSFLCKSLNRYLIYPVPVATHQVVGRGIIFLFMGENLAFCASH